MEIIGHESIRKKLRQQVADSKVGHAYLFLGKEGIGKKMVATEFAKNMMCFSPVQGKACESCEGCHTFGNTSDFSLIEPDNQTIKVDVIRSLQEEIYLKPTHSNRKCIIVDDADCMNENAQNALLKVLEEPPMYASIILVTANKGKLLKTIQSRVVEEVFQSLSKEDLIKILGQDFNKESIEFASGSVTRALKLADNDEINIAQKMINAFQTQDMLSIHHEIMNLKDNKNIKVEILDVFEMMNLICYQKLKENVNQYLRFIQIIENAKYKIQRNANLDLTLDDMMIQVCYK